MNRAKRQKMNHRVGFVRMGSKRSTEKKSFTWLYRSMPCAQDMRNYSKCWLERWYKRVIMDRNNFGATNKLLRNWGACVDTVFWHVSRNVIFVKEEWPIWKKLKDEQGWNQPVEPVRWIRGICREDVDLFVLVLSRWRVADEVRKGEEDPDSMKILMIWL